MTHRNYGIDLLKIIAMIMTLLLHILWGVGRLAYFQRQCIKQQHGWLNVHHIVQ